MDGIRVAMYNAGHLYLLFLTSHLTSPHANNSWYIFIVAVVNFPLRYYTGMGTFVQKESTKRKV